MYAYVLQCNILIPYQQNGKKTAINKQEHFDLKAEINAHFVQPPYADRTPHSLLHYSIFY